MQYSLDHLLLAVECVQRCSDKKDTQQVFYLQLHDKLMGLTGSHLLKLQLHCHFLDTLLGRSIQFVGPKSMTSLKTLFHPRTLSYMAKPTPLSTVQEASGLFLSIFLHIVGEEHHLLILSIALK